MTNPRHVAPLFVLLLSLGCANDRKQSEPMQPASYEAPPPEPVPTTTNEPKGLPPGTPPNDSPMDPSSPEGAGTLQKNAPSAPLPAAGGRGGMGGMGGIGGTLPRGGSAGTSPVRDGGMR